MSFISNNDEIATQLRVLSHDTLLESIRRFYANIPSCRRTKAGLTQLIMDDFREQTSRLVHSSPEDIYELVSPPPHFPRLVLPLVCQFIHNQYGSVTAPQLLAIRRVGTHPLLYLLTARQADVAK